MQYKAYGFKSINDLAQKAGVNQGSISSFLSNARPNITFETAWKILSAFGLHMPELGSTNPTLHEIKKLQIEVDELKKELYREQGKSEELRNLLKEQATQEAIHQKRKTAS